MNIYSVLLSAVFALLVAPANASLSYQPSTTPDGTRVLLVSGGFDPDENLEAFLEAVRSSFSTTVSFNSPGGSVMSAIRLGRSIRALGLSTFQLRQMECASACALAFVGGTSRLAEAGSIGVHQSSFAPSADMSRDDAVANVQLLTAEILAYLKEMGVSADFLSFSLRYAKDDIRYLSLSEMRELGIVSDPEEFASQTIVSADPSSPTEPGKASAADISRATQIIRSLIEDDPSVQVVARRYAPTISYYGKVMPLADVIADKDRYRSRWPERNYRVRDESLLVTCANGHCMVSGIYEWMVRSIPRNKHARGTAKFNYTIDMSGEPLVIAEQGQVIR